MGACHAYTTKGDAGALLLEWPYEMEDKETMSGKAKKREQKQETPQGHEIPLPKRSEIMRALHKITGPAKKKT